MRVKDAGETTPKYAGFDVRGSPRVRSVTQARGRALLGALGQGRPGKAQCGRGGGQKQVDLRGSATLPIRFREALSAIHDTTYYLERTSRS